MLLYGTTNADVEEFLFMYDNACMRKKRDDEKASSRFAYLGREARVAYCAKFIDGWSPTEDGKHYEKVCEWIISKHRKSIEPDE